MRELEYIKLTEEDVAAELSKLDGWALDGGQIAKTFQFDAYLRGAAFAGRVAEEAERLNHHPDLLLTWCRVRVSMNTHDVGGISPYDFELAHRIEGIAEQG